MMTAKKTPPLKSHLEERRAIMHALESLSRKLTKVTHSINQQHEDIQLLKTLVGAIDGVLSNQFQLLTVIGDKLDDLATAIAALPGGVSPEIVAKLKADIETLRGTLPDTPTP